GPVRDRRRSRCRYSAVRGADTRGYDDALEWAATDRGAAECNCNLIGPRYSGRVSGTVSAIAGFRDCGRGAVRAGYGNGDVVGHAGYGIATGVVDGNADRRGAARRAIRNRGGRVRGGRSADRNRNRVGNGGRDAAGGEPQSATADGAGDAQVGERSASTSIGRNGEHATKRAAPAVDRRRDHDTGLCYGIAAGVAHLHDGLLGEWHTAGRSRRWLRLQRELGAGVRRDGDHGRDDRRETGRGEL